jgi:hypothetical protein
MTPKTRKPAANSAKQQRGRPFPKGVSGNPAGRPLGSRHKVTLAVEALLDGQHEALTQKAIDLALAGDTVALRLCLDRIAPTRKGRPVALELPSVETAADVLKALGVVVAETASGTITPEEAVMIASVFETKRKAIETVDIERRLMVLERGAEKR